jgi:hypothetical protein
VAVDSFVTIPKGKVRANLPVTIIPNSSRTEDAAFSVHVARADGAILQPFSVPVTIINTDYARLAWSDEFDASELNTADWNFELGNNNGWGNNELEIYTNSAANVFIENGNLVIRGLKRRNTYTSGRITTQNKRTFTIWQNRNQSYSAGGERHLACPLDAGEQYLHGGLAQVR